MAAVMATHFVTFAKDVMFSLALVCLFASSRDCCKNYCTDFQKSGGSVAHYILMVMQITLHFRVGLWLGVGQAISHDNGFVGGNRVMPYDNGYVLHTGSFTWRCLTVPILQDQRP